MKGQYLEERLGGPLFKFGETKELVGLATPHSPQVAAVSPEAADSLVSYSQQQWDFLVKMARAFDRAAPEAFQKFYYGG